MFVSAPQKSREVSHSTKISGGNVGAVDIAGGKFGSGSFGIQSEQAYYPNNNNQGTYGSDPTANSVSLRCLLILCVRQPNA